MTAPTTRTAGDDLELELLGRLGLGRDTTPEQLEATHEAVAEFLAAAPRNLRGWARHQASAADEAFALLSDPAALARAASTASSPRSATASAVEAPVVSASRLASATERPPDAATVKRGTSRPSDAQHMTEDQQPSDDELDELIAEVTPSAHRDEVQRPPTSARGIGIAGSWKGRRSSSRRLVAAAALVVGVAAVLAIGYNLGGGGQPVTAAVASPSASPGLDQAQVAALMQKIAANPNDTTALMGLGNAYFAAGQYSIAADWLGKVVKIDAKNVEALLALGAAQFNDGDAKDAETNWKQVVSLDPKNVEAHYDLGFLYLQEQPSDLAGMKREWEQVVALAPGTQVAQSVQAHLDALASASPGASGAAPAASAGARGSSASPAASGVAAPSRTPSASALP